MNHRDKLMKHMRWIMIVIVVTFLLSTFFMYEGRSRRRGVRGADGTMEDYEVAQINGRPLMRSELERRVRAELENYGRSMASVDLPALYQSALDAYILESQMNLEVRDRGIEISDAEVDQAMKAYADQVFPTREAFYQYIERSGMSVADYKRGLAHQMANETMLRDAIGSVTVSEDEAVQFYDSMKNIFYRKPAGFMINIANFASSEDAEALRASLAAGKAEERAADWEKLTSGDALASRDIVNVTHEPVFLSASSLTSGTFAFLDSLDVGQVSAVTEISSGDYAVGVKTEKVEESISSYDEVSADIRIMLQRQEERIKLMEFQTELMTKAKVVIYDDSIFPQPVSEDAAPSDEAPAAESASETPAAESAESAAPAAEEAASADPAASEPVSSEDKK